MVDAILTSILGQDRCSRSYYLTPKTKTHILANNLDVFSKKVLINCKRLNCGPHLGAQSHNGGGGGGGVEAAKTT